MFLPNPQALSTDERQAFEAYLMAGSDEAACQKAIGQLVNGSVPQMFLHFVNLMTRGAGDLSEKDTKELEQFINKNKNTYQARQLKLWHQLRTFDKITDPAEREAILKEVTQANFQFDHKKPSLPEGIKAHDSSTDDENDDKSRLPADFFNPLPDEPNLTLHEQILKKEFTKMKEQLATQLKQTTDEKEKQRIITEIELRHLVQMALHAGGLLHDIDWTKYSPISVLKFTQSAATLISSIDNESFFTQLVTGVHEFTKLQSADETVEDGKIILPDYLCTNMSIAQLDKLAQLDPTFKNNEHLIGAYFQKTFCEDLNAENQGVMTTQEKIQTLKRLYEHAKSKQMPKEFQRKFLEEILCLSPEIGEYPKYLLLDLIAMMDKHECAHFKDYKKPTEEVTRQKANQFNWNQYCHQVVRNTSSNKMTSLFDEYLDEFCEQQNASLADFSSVFTKQYLEKIEQKWQVLLSEDGLKSLDQDKIGLEQFKRISEQVNLTFSKRNKQTFDIDETVSLQVIIKNIKLLHVSIFEFNTETYYKKNLKPFDTSVNLEGLDASEKIEKTYDQPSNMRHREVFDFPQLNGKIGLFIIELMGNGYSARAVIKKGGLSLVHRSTIAGQLAYIIDHNKKVCYGKDTKIVLSGKEYTCDAETGRFFIPYATVESSERLIMIHNGFAQLGEFMRKTESYGFEPTFFLPQGATLVGTNTSVLIRGDLRINGRKANLNLLKKVKVVLSTVSFIDNMPVTKTFQNLAFDNDKDLAVTFQVPPNLKKITVELSCEVMNATTKKPQKWNKSHNFDICTNESVPNTLMSMPFLRKNDKGCYEVAFLGRNGEPATKQKVQICMNHCMFDESKTAELITNKEGIVNLGPLQYVSGLKARLDSDKSWRGTWQLQQADSTGSVVWSYPQNQTVNLLEGENWSLPVMLPHGFDSLDRKWLRVSYSHNGQLVDDYFEHVKLEHHGDKVMGYYCIAFNGLNQGHYSLEIFQDYRWQSLTIEVHRGEPWGGEGFILKKTHLRENTQQQNIVKISHFRTFTENNKQMAEVKVENTTGKAHLHVYATQYLPSNQQELWQQVTQSQTQSFAASRFLFAQWQNIYQSDRRMADEIRYVFDRKQLATQLGNTLDRPTLLNQRQKLGATNTEGEFLMEGDLYQNNQEMMQQVYTQQMMPMSNMMPRSQQIDMGGFGGRMQNRMMKQQISRHEDLMFNGPPPSAPMRMGGMLKGSKEKKAYDEASTSLMHMGLSSFLKTPPIQHLNIMPVKDDSNAEGMATFRFEMGNTGEFAQLSLIVIDKASVTQRVFDSKSLSEIKKRDLRNLTIEDPNQGLQEERQTTKLANGDKTKIKDITSTEVTLVDDLSKISEILSEVRKVREQPDGDLANHLEFIPRWHQMSSEEKNKTYSDYLGHELNFFIFKKDPAYFAQTVKPFIQSKMEKQFMDFYLIGHTEKVLSYAEPDKFNQETLTVLEMCLVVQTLAQNGQKTKALALATRMQLQNADNNSNNPDAVSQRNKIFDLVLNLNSLNQNKDALKQLKEVAEQKKKEEQEIDFQKIMAAALLQKAALQRQQAKPAPKKAIARQQFSDEEDSYRGGDYQDSSVRFVERTFSLDSGGSANSGCLDYDRSSSPPAMSLNTRSAAPKMQKKAMQFQQPAFLSYNARNEESYEVRAKFDSDDDVMEQRTKVMKQQNFEELEETSEYMETHYYNRKDSHSMRNLMRLSQFWCDLALHWAQGGTMFMSQSFTDCVTSSHESFFAVCVIDLPMVAEKAHDFQPDEGRGVYIEAASNLIMFKKEIRPCKLNLGRKDIMIIHRYEEMGTQAGKSGKPDEFLARTPYRCEVVVTNIAPVGRSFELLYQIPVGAVPLRQSKYVKSQFVNLPSYNTEKFSFDFYFPSAGEFEHSASNISEDGQVTVRGGKTKITVVNSRRLGKIESFLDIIHAGSKADILNYLRTKNLHKADFNCDHMLHLLKDKEFFTQVIQILREKCLYFPQVWEYALYHRDDTKLIAEWLKKAFNNNLQRFVGPCFKSGLVETDDSLNQETPNFHIEYYPMVNARTHMIGDKRRILNTNFRDTYDRFLRTKILKGSLTNTDLMQFAYYLQLQDRISEAISIFQKVEEPAEEGTLRLQYDYMQAYFDFYNGKSTGMQNVKRIVEKYENYPVATWRMMFLTIQDQLAEIAGEFENVNLAEIEAGITTTDEAVLKQQRTQNKKEAKKRAPEMNVEVGAGGSLQVESVNIRSVEVNYYKIDAELLFSRQPFLKDSAQGFSYVKAYYTLVKEIHQRNATEEAVNQFVSSEIPLPSGERGLQNDNLLIEVKSGDLQKFLTYYHSSLKVNVLEAYGELKVTTKTAEGKDVPLPRTYVKVYYQKKSGGEAFYRDGYTDICGKIEYAQTSGDKLKDVQKFAILVHHDKHGSKILECNPPKDVQGNGQSVGGDNKGGASLGMAEMKMNRLQNRQQFSKMNKAQKM